jgi:hypothetical protein
VIAFLIYLLCAITSIACAVLLLRGYLRSRARLLLWSALCFVGLSINNLALLVDMRLAMDHSTVRSIPSLIGVMLLVFGLIWDSDR